MAESAKPGETREAKETSSGFDPEAAGTEVPAEETLESLKKKLEEVRAEAGANYDRYLRTAADFDNYRKRASRETEDFRKYANQSLVKDLLPVVDDLERALAASAQAPPAEAPLRQGVELTLRSLLKVLENHEVRSFESLGKPFDPAVHQAVLRRECPDATENTVIEEFQKGYTLNDRLIRPAMVVVSCGKAPEAGTAEESN